MKKTITKWNAKEYFDFFSSLPKGLGNNVFKLFKFDGLEATRAQHDIVQSLFSSIESDEYLSCIKEKKHIIDTYAIKDQYGRPKYKGASIEVQPEDVVKVQEEIAKIDEKYKDAIIDHDSEYNEVYELVNKETVEVEIPTIHFCNIPDEIGEDDFQFIHKHFLMRSEQPIA